MESWSYYWGDGYVALLICLGINVFGVIKRDGKR